MHEHATLEQQVRDYLTLMVRLHHELPDGYAYRGPGDVVLQRGQVFTPAPLPRRYRPGLPSHCFHNAYLLAVRERKLLRYCEGYAAGLLPVEHAWCLDADDRVVDPTWTGDSIGEVYLGVVVDLAVVRAARRRGSTTALFDWRGRYPLCRR